MVHPMAADRHPGPAEGPQVVAGGYLVKPEATLSDRGSTIMGVPVGGTSGEQGFDAQPMSHFNVATPATEDLWLGLSVTIPFGLAAKYNPDYSRRYDSIEARIITVDVAPSVAYAVTPRLSIGGGVDLQ